jgi:hypothetical protein
MRDLWGNRIVRSGRAERRCLGLGGRLGLGPVRKDRVVATMALEVAVHALFLHVTQLAFCRQLAVAADHAATCECAKSEEPNQTHMEIPIGGTNLLCGRFWSKPYAAQLHRVGLIREAARSLFLGDFLLVGARTVAELRVPVRGEVWIRFNGLERAAWQPALRPALA